MLFIFFNTSVNLTSVTVVFLHWCINMLCSIRQSNKMNKTRLGMMHPLKTAMLLSSINILAAKQSGCQTSIFCTRGEGTTLEVARSPQRFSLFSSSNHFLLFFGNLATLQADTKQIRIRSKCF